MKVKTEVSELGKRDAEDEILVASKRFAEDTEYAFYVETYNTECARLSELIKLYEDPDLADENSAANRIGAKKDLLKLRQQKLQTKDQFITSRNVSAYSTPVSATVSSSGISSTAVSSNLPSSDSLSAEVGHQN